MFALVVKVKVIKGKEKEFEEMMRAAAEKVRQNEKGTLMYDMHHKIGDTTEVLFYERYTDKDAWEKIHMSQPYIKEVIDKLPNYIVGELDIAEYEVIAAL